MKGTDPYTYPGSDVLRNRPGIRDAGHLQSFEYRRTAERSLELGERPIQGRLDFAHFKAIHKHLFGDVYDWAGESRTVSITKGTSTFAMPRQIEGYGGLVFSELAKEQHLRGLTQERFVQRLAFHFSEINALHPFREGNGRTTRAFLNQLANEAGFSIDYTQVDAATWNEASRASFASELGPVEQLLRRITAPNASVDIVHPPDQPSPPRTAGRASRPG